MLKSLPPSDIARARLDKCIARLEAETGWVAGSHFADACALQWIDGCATSRAKFSADAQHAVKTGNLRQARQVAP